MKKIYELENTRTHERHYIECFTRLEIGAVIYWGSDTEQPNGLAHWEVIREF